MVDHLIRIVDGRDPYLVRHVRVFSLPDDLNLFADLKITPDIAGATFMASATSFPEMSVNVIATFVTESDLGIGTIVGGTVCNTLAVAGIAGLATSQVRVEKFQLHIK